MHALQAKLDAGASELGLGLSAKQSDCLLAFVDLLGKWGRVYNLTAVRDPQDMLTLHLMDSLSVVRPLRQHLARRELGGARVLDVGSGAGLPGVVLAICCPELQVTCVDAVAKKVAFVTQVAVALQLPNLRGLHARVEKTPGCFDVVTARAFASLSDLVAWSAHALASDGVWVAMKGKEPVDEVAALPPSVRMFHVEQLQVPGLDAQRCLVWLEQAPTGAPDGAQCSGAQARK